MLQAENEKMAQELRDLAARTEVAERERQVKRAERERQAKLLAEITAFLQHFGQVNGVPVLMFAPVPPPVIASPVSMNPYCFD
jgi:Skp family chaperone for outer membrane proteins